MARLAPSGPPHDPPLGPQSGTRNPERPILLACGAVGLLFALLAVLERLGVDRSVLAALAVALPLGAVALLAILGRTIERLPFAVDGARGGALAGGLALGAEWMGMWLVPAVVLLPAVTAQAAPILGSALGIALAALVTHGAMRRMGTFSLPTFLALRTGSRLGGLAVVPATLVAVAGLLVFQAALLHALLVPFVGPASGTVLAVFVVLAALVCLVGGQRSLTLVNAFLGFFLTLAMVVPAITALAGLDGLTAAAPLDRAFAAVLPEGPTGGPGGPGALVAIAALALAALALPSFGIRLAAVRPGGPARAASWALLAGYVTMAAAGLAFARAALAPGLAVAANGDASILSVLPALGWLGAVWAGLAMSLFALAATLARDVRITRLRLDRPPRPWMDMGGLVAMRLVFIATPLALPFVDLAPVTDPDTARVALATVIVAAAGCLAPALLAGTLWRHVTVPSLVVGQVAGAVAAYGLSGLSGIGTLPLALLTAAATTLALVAGSLVTPRRYRPRPSLVLQVRDP